MRYILAAAAFLFAFVPTAAHAAPVEVEYKGRSCLDNGNTKIVFRLTNNTNRNRYPGYWFHFTDTGFEMGEVFVKKNSSGKVRFTIPSGRTIDYIAFYRSGSSDKVIWEREKNIKSLDC